MGWLGLGLIAAVIIFFRRLGWLGIILGLAIGVYLYNEPGS
jgi:hypothetical protein